MSFYQYIAVNKENKQLTGTINAPQIQEARNELNGLGFSILSISEIDEATYQKLRFNKSKFEFSAFDKLGKKIIGTIVADDKYQAYKRLNQEYSFNVISLVAENSSPENKKMEISRGLESLKSLYQIEQRQKQEELSNIKADVVEDKKENDDEKRKILDQKIKLILFKIDEILTTYSDELDQTKVKEIKVLVNKLIRIKSSTNTEFIEQTCEELLKKTQDQELFLKNSQKFDDKNKISLETKKLLIDLHRKGKSHTSFLTSLSQKIDRMRSKNDSFISKIFSPFLSRLMAALQEPDEIKLMKLQLKNINSQILTYLKIYLTSSKEEKNQVTVNLKNLYSQRKLFIYKIKKLKSKYKETKEKQNSFLHSIYMETNLFTGWLLLFYLCLYFLAGYSQTKELTFIPDYLRDLYQISFLKKFLLIIFTIHAFTSIKINYFAKNNLISIIFIPLSIFISIFLLSNF